MKKQCTGCKVTKSIDEFGVNSGAKSGVHFYCKDCVNTRSLKYHHANKSVVIAKKRVYQDKNWETISEQKKEYRARPEIKESRRKLAQNAYHNNPVHREVKKIRRMLSGVYTGGRSVAESTFVEAIGCTRAEFISYINERLTGDMTPENYTKVWNFDHIVPYGTCDTLEEVHIYSHYTNVQPMLKLENARKKDTKIGSYK